MPTTKSPGISPHKYRGYVKVFRPHPNLSDSNNEYRRVPVLKLTLPPSQVAPPTVHDQDQNPSIHPLSPETL